MDKLDQAILVAYSARILAKLAAVHQWHFDLMRESQADFVSAAIVTAWHESRATDDEIVNDIAQALFNRASHQA